jgi:LuxR family transcriptional regulator
VGPDRSRFGSGACLRPFRGGESEAAPEGKALDVLDDGKTAQSIALLMGLSAATVEKHLRLAREALDVESTARAVL